IFPAISEKWRNCSFENIHVPGGFIVSAEMKNSVVTSVKVKSVSGGKLQIEINEKRHSLDFNPGETKLL
ncbi:MAG: hypothetical protein KAG97_12455, partial [Victivallales bacterium]|nr:hypothetical protein [Victivallales bacterium]